MVEYADYKFYTEEFKGSTIPDTAFLNAILRASIFVKYITFNRVDETSTPEEVKLAACAVAEVFYKDMLARDEAGREKASENNDGYSVSYVTSANSQSETVEKKAYKEALMYLADTGLMYRGMKQ
ncbi:MAG: hypothetical protein PHT21_11590 [Lachnospiraceae bacterium]|nr:hypothetical protein [Lachnospiraceae bacterium]